MAKGRRQGFGESPAEILLKQKLGTEEYNRRKLEAANKNVSKAFGGISEGVDLGWEGSGKVISFGTPKTPNPFFQGGWDVEILKKYMDEGLDPFPQQFSSEWTVTAEPEQPQEPNPVQDWCDQWEKKNG